ncbi:MAG: cytochrome c family protein [Alphaproteobacteria bacterium]|nr:cytochrome c family protein [Alphaproteobacteria bacterium]
MDSWEWNKIAGAVLGTLIFVIVVGLVAHAVYQVPEPAKPGYIVPGVKVASSSHVRAKPKAEPLPDFATAIPAANLEHGEKLAERCAACHDWAKGGPNKIGPNLYDILGNKRGVDRNGYDFSAAMKAKGGTWTYAELFRFLRDPQEYIPGTKMTFPGLPNPQDRLDVIKFIRTWADTPYPLPPPAATTKAGSTKATKAPQAADTKAKAH